MTYCAYCGAAMRETADVCPACGKWKRQVEMPGGKATVKEPPESEKTRIYNRPGVRPASNTSAASAQPRAQVTPRQTRPASQASVSPARQQPVHREPTAAAQPVRREPAAARQPEKNVSAQVKETVAAAADTVKTRVQTAGRDVSVALGKVQIPKTKLYAVLGFLAALILVIVISASVASGSGAHGVVKKLARAYDRQSAEQMTALAGDLMRALYPDGELEEECRKNIDVVRDVFSDRLGSRYSFSYKITLGKTYQGDELQSRLESTYGDLGGAFDLSRVKAMTTATLTLQAKHGGAKAEKRISVILVKENGKWKLASQLV